MSKTEIISLIVALVSVIISAIIVILYKRRLRTILNNMSDMIDSAIDGSFSEKIYDESMISSVESKLSNFLYSSEVSSKNISNEKNKIKELLSDISHQTKTPIANILLYSELLEEFTCSERERECASSLKLQAEKLSFLIGALVKTSRLETGVFVLNPNKEKISVLIKCVCDEIYERAYEKNISINIEDNDIIADFDLKWTMEALYNIVDNAVKYTSTGGTISISASAYNLFCRIDIKDNGIGISEDEYANIFRRFYRSKEVSDSEGVGIGLYLSREIISGQGGYIKVISEVGKGSVFSVFLPMPK